MTNVISIDNKTHTILKQLSGDSNLNMGEIVKVLVCSASLSEIFDKLKSFYIKLKSGSKSKSLSENKTQNKNKTPDYGKYSREYFEIHGYYEEKDYKCEQDWIDAEIKTLTDEEYDDDDDYEEPTIAPPPKR